MISGQQRNTMICVALANDSHNDRRKYYE
jgi:hypothetical protein